MITPLPMLLLSTLLFTIGTEVRRGSKMGGLLRVLAQVRAYPRKVSAYILFLK
jgi:hypothetical protein